MTVSPALFRRELIESFIVALITVPDARLAGAAAGFAAGAGVAAGAGAGVGLGRGAAGFGAGAGAGSGAAAAGLIVQRRARIHRRELKVAAQAVRRGDVLVLIAAARGERAEREGHQQGSATSSMPPWHGLLGCRLSVTLQPHA